MAPAGRDSTRVHHRWHRPNGLFVSPSRASVAASEGKGYVPPRVVGIGVEGPHLWYHRRVLAALRRSEGPVSAGVHHAVGPPCDLRRVPSQGSRRRTPRWPSISLPCPICSTRCKRAATWTSCVRRCSWCCRRSSSWKPTSTSAPPATNAARPAPPIATAAGPGCCRRRPATSSWPSPSCVTAASTRRCWSRAGGSTGRCGR